MTISLPVKVCGSQGEPLSIADHLRFSSEAEAVALSKSIDLPDSEIEPFFAVAQMHLTCAAATEIRSQEDAIATCDRVIADIHLTVTDDDYQAGRIDDVHVDLMKSLRDYLAKTRPPATI
jgi:hypothetical protein